MSGNSAYLFADVDDTGIRVVDALKEPRHKNHEDCAAFLCAILERHAVDAVAVDAPLSLPLPLIEPGYSGPEREGSGEIVNPFLYRYTDYWFYRKYGLKPMPPAGDRIGRLTARMIALLQQCDYRTGSIALQGSRIPFYEVYPKQIAHALGFESYKKQSEALLERLGPDSVPEDEHLLDALLCCYGGAQVLKGHTVMPPDAAVREGWCYPVVPGQSVSIG